MKTNSSAVIVPVPVPATTTNIAAVGDIRDIKAPVEIPSGWAWLWWTLGAMILASAVFAAVRTWSKHRPKAKTLTIIIPPHERARRKLQEALGLLDQPRPFCILVSDAVRLYLEEAFSMRAPERTTEEFLDELQSSALLSMAQKQLLGDFLMRCDLVKFARYEPPQEQLQELYQSALRLIDETQSLVRSLQPQSTVRAEPNHASPITEPAAAERPSPMANHKS
jgi:hypothetical protein